MRPEVLLLDCGGTLSWPPFDRVRALVSELRGVEIDHTHPYEGFYRSSHALEMYLREHGRPPADDPLAIQHWLYLTGFRLTGDAGVWTQECTDELVRREQRMGAWDFTFSWVGTALERLSREGYPMAVVSNSDGQVTQLLEQLGYARYMDVIVDSHLEGIAKPDARLFHLALQRLGRSDLAEQASLAAAGKAQPPAVLHVGDHFRADYIGAREAGLNACLIDPFELYPDLPASQRTTNVLSLAEMLGS